MIIVMRYVQTSMAGAMQMKDFTATADGYLIGCFRRKEKGKITIYLNNLHLPSGHEWKIWSHLFSISVSALFLGLLPMTVNSMHFTLNNEDVNDLATFSSKAMPNKTIVKPTGQDKPDIYGSKQESRYKDGGYVATGGDNTTTGGGGYTSVGGGYTSVGDGNTSVGDGNTSVGDGYTSVGGCYTSVGDGYRAIRGGIGTNRTITYGHSLPPADLGHISSGNICGVHTDIRGYTRRACNPLLPWKQEGVQSGADKPPPPPTLPAVLTLYVSIDSPQIRYSNFQNWSFLCFITVCHFVLTIP